MAPGDKVKPVVGDTATFGEAQVISDSRIYANSVKIMTQDGSIFYFPKDRLRVVKDQDFPAWTYPQVSGTDRADGMTFEEYMAACSYARRSNRKYQYA